MRDQRGSTDNTQHTEQSTIKSSYELTKPVFFRRIDDNGTQAEQTREMNSYNRFLANREQGLASLNYRKGP